MGEVSLITTGWLKSLYIGLSWGDVLKKRLFVVSSGFQQILDRCRQQVDDTDEGLVVSISPSATFGGLENVI